MSNSPKKVLLSWSSGKDCAYALHLLRQAPNCEVVGLFTSINEMFQRVAMHAVRIEILQAQADSIDLPLDLIPLPYPCSNNDYGQRMNTFITSAEQRGITHFAFGDLFLENVHQYRIYSLSHSTIEPLFPVWQMPTTSFSKALLDEGIKAITTCVDPQVLPKEQVGKHYNAEFIAKLPEGIDPCGENGEFHTFVYDGPMFQHPLNIEVGELIERDGFAFADLILI